MNLFEAANKFKEKISKIKVLVFDIDGVLTPGHVWWASEEVGFNRVSHTSDGYGLRLMMQEGFKVGVISGGDSVGVRKRFVENLKLDFAFLGDEDKRDAYKKITDMGYSDSEIFYMGDEFFDIPLMDKAGFSATVPSASFEVKEFADYVTTRESGQAAAREVIDIIRYARGIVPEVRDFNDNLIDFKKTWPSS